VDTRKFCDDFTAKLTNNGNGNPEFTNLPRKVFFFEEFF
jgi:hypothetical protein